MFTKQTCHLRPVQTFVRTPCRPSSPWQRARGRWSGFLLPGTPKQSLLAPRGSRNQGGWHRWRSPATIKRLYLISYRSFNIKGFHTRASNPPNNLKIPFGKSCKRIGREHCSFFFLKRSCLCWGTISVLGTFFMSQKRINNIRIQKESRTLVKI